jgi:hypothetical protein
LQSHCCIDIDAPRFDRPEPPAPGLVAQVRALIGRADEHALPRFDDLAPSVTWTITLDGPGNERFQQSDFGPVHGVHLGDFDEPLTAQVLADVLTRRDIRQVILEPLAPQDATRGRFYLTLNSFKHQHMIGLASRLEDPRDHGN